MELFLNLLWFIVAAGLTGFLICHQRGRVPHLHWGSVLAATLFISVLLFPAISASDDLNGQLFLSEDASRRSLSLISAHIDLAPTVALVSFLLFRPSLGVPHYSGRIVESSSLIVLLPSCVPPAGLRAPPADFAL